jgi:competence protein ComEA
VRTASIALTLLGLAAIGSTSFAHMIAPALPGNAPATAPANAMQASLLSIGSATATAAPHTHAPAAVPAPTQGLAEASPSQSSETTPAANDTAANGSERGPAAPAAGSAESGLTTDGKVILNTATVAQLDRLPSVGLKRAEQIVALRERLGRFKSLNDLLRIKGIGVRSLKKMLPMLVLDPPKDPEPQNHSPPTAKQ